VDKYNSWIAKLARPIGCKDEWAITLGQTTYYSCDESEVTPGWRAHENQHKMQWRRDGKVKFLFRYLWQALAKGYLHIDYEIEARQAANKVKNG